MALTVKTRQGTQSLDVWVVSGYRVGENSQIFALAERLNPSYKVKRLNYNGLSAAAGLMRQKSLGGIDWSTSSAIEPPWPDLVISAGLRNEPVCQWIRMASGGRTRIVHIGRPWASLDRFDLIITTPQYRLPGRSNILQNQLTLNGITAAQLQEAASIWGPRFAYLPGPYIGVLIGGNSNPFTFGPNAARRLGTEISKLAQEAGGSVLITTSARTPRSPLAQLRATLRVPAYLFEWKPDAKENPYHGILALSSRLVVTADSIAMLSEAAATGKPVYIFNPNDPVADFRWTAGFYRLLMKIGPQRATRDVGLVHDYLFATGRATRLGHKLPVHRLPPPDDMERAISRVTALFDNTRTGL